MPPPKSRDAAGPVVADRAEQQLEGAWASTDSLDRSLLAELAGAYVVRVVVNDCGGARTYLYRTLSGAEGAVTRAHARGRDATVVLCELRPLEVVT